MLGAWSLCGVVEVLELLKKRSLLPASMGTFTYMPIHTRARITKLIYFYLMGKQAGKIAQSIVKFLPRINETLGST